MKMQNVVLAVHSVALNVRDDNMEIFLAHLLLSLCLYTHKTIMAIAYDNALIQMPTQYFIPSKIRVFKECYFCQLV